MCRGGESDAGKMDHHFPLVAVLPMLPQRVSCKSYQCHLILVVGNVLLLDQLQ